MAHRSLPETSAEKSDFGEPTGEPTSEPTEADFADLEDPTGGGEPLGISETRAPHGVADGAGEPSPDVARTTLVEKRAINLGRRRMWRASDGDYSDHVSRGRRGAPGELLEGNARYVSEDRDHSRQDAERRESLVPSQHPHTAVLSCSDSRVPPEIVFDQGLGDLFVVRNAGEVADDVAIASLEYSVEHLHVKNILILGHESCGAVKAALTTPPGTSAGSKDLDLLLRLIRPDLKGMTVESAGPRLSDAVRAHVLKVRERMLKRSAIIREAVEHGNVKLMAGLYHLDTGVVDLVSGER